MAKSYDDFRRKFMKQVCGLVLVTGTNKKGIKAKPLKVQMHPAYTTGGMMISVSNFTVPYSFPKVPKRKV